MSGRVAEGCGGGGGRGGWVILVVQPNRKMEKAKKQIAPFNMNEISTSPKTKLPQYKMKCKKFSFDEDGRRARRTKEDLIRKSEWVTLKKIQVSWKQDLNFF
jgi:hypothetical protein